MTTREQVLALLATPHTRRELREALKLGRSRVNWQVSALLASGDIRPCGNVKTKHGWAQSLEVAPDGWQAPRRPALVIMTHRRLGLLASLRAKPMTHAQLAAEHSVSRITIEGISRDLVLAGLAEFGGFAPRVESRGPQPWLWKITAKGREALVVAPLTFRPDSAPSWADPV